MCSLNILKNYYPRDKKLNFFMKRQRDGKVFIGEHRVSVDERIPLEMFHEQIHEFEHAISLGQYYNGFELISIHRHIAELQHVENLMKQWVTDKNINK